MTKDTTRNRIAEAHTEVAKSDGVVYAVRTVTGDDFKRAMEEYAERHGVRTSSVFALRDILTEWFEKEHPAGDAEVIGDMKHGGIVGLRPPAIAYPVRVRDPE